ncbi:MAG: anti-sigma factor family protein [Acidobacteriota bacterium]
MAEEGHEHCRQLFERICAQIEGDLAPGSCAELSRHMESCEPCRRFLESMAATRKALERYGATSSFSGQEVQELLRGCLDRFRSLETSRSPADE